MFVGDDAGFVRFGVLERVWVFVFSVLFYLFIIYFRCCFFCLLFCLFFILFNYFSPVWLYLGFQIRTIPCVLSPAWDRRGYKSATHGLWDRAWYREID